MTWQVPQSWGREIVSLGLSTVSGKQQELNEELFDWINEYFQCAWRPNTGNFHTWCRGRTTGNTLRPPVYPLFLGFSHTGLPSPRAMPPAVGFLSPKVLTSSPSPSPQSVPDVLPPFILPSSAQSCSFCLEFSAPPRPAVRVCFSS